MIIRTLYKDSLDFFTQLYKNRVLIYELTKRDFKTKYIENLLGISWAILEPIAMMVILWFVFTFMRTRQSDVPFALYLLSGLVMYDLFNKGLNRGTRSIKEFSFLVSKFNIRLAVLPLVKLFSEIIIHLLILIILCIFLIFYNYIPNWYWIQFLYYLFAAFSLLVGLCWITSSIVLFFKDLTIVITITMRVLFFLTPIFWSLDQFPEPLKTYLSFNPLTYLVNGYRNSFIYNIPFWDDMPVTIFYWSFTLVILIVGVLTFKRLRPQFADVI